MVRCNIFLLQRTIPMSSSQSSGRNNRPHQCGDWANGHYKGQCAQDEHIAGVAYNWRRTPDALLCRK